MIPGYRFAAGAAWLIVATALHAAGLKWTATAHTVTADPARSEIAASFAFSNENDVSITITEVQTSCGCTAATLGKKTYARGESGKIDVVLHYTGDVSPIEEAVTVITDEPGGKPQRLALKVVIPIQPQRGRVEIRPRIVRWTRGARVQSQVVNLRITHPDDALRLVAAAANDPAFRVQLREPRVDDPGLYELVITPVALDHARIAEIVVSTNSGQLEKGGAPIVYRIAAVIE